MRAVALVAAMSLFGGCFPHNAHQRTIAQLVEGGTLGLGVGMEYFANTQADCDQAKQMGQPPASCGGVSQAIGSVGVVLILAGLVGFISTVSTAEDDTENTGSGSAAPASAIAE
jgi:hypothetical protein